MATQLIEATGDVAAVKVEAGSRLHFSFDISTDASSFDREGGALIITLKDGRKVVLEDFFVVAKDGDELPVFVLDDATEVASADFLLSMNPDLDVTASGQTSGGTGEYAADTDVLAEWSDVLGKAETDTWSSGTSAPDPVLSSEYVSLATSYSETASDGWSLPPTSGGATITPPLPPDERPSEPSLPTGEQLTGEQSGGSTGEQSTGEQLTGEQPGDPSDEQPSEPPLLPPSVTPDGPAVPVLDERFVFSRDNAGPENFEHVLRNDGEGVKLTGVLDEDGYLVTLAALAGDGLETRTGKLFMKDGILVFEPKPGVGADDTEIVTYVGVDADGKTYTRNVEIRFTDTAGVFRSDDAVDTYYVNTNNAGSADLQFGADEGAAVTGVGGAGNDSISVKSLGTYMAYRGSSVDIDAGDGNDTIEIEAAQTMAYGDSTLPVTVVTVAGGAGDDSVSVKSLGYGMARYNSSVNVSGGDGNDTIALEAAGVMVSPRSTVSVDGGEGDDFISVKSLSTSKVMVVSDSSMIVDGGDGNDTIEIEGSTILARAGSTVIVNGGEGDDSISVIRPDTLWEMIAESSSLEVDAGVGNDTIVIEAACHVADSTSTVTINGGAGDDLIEMRGGRVSNNVSLTGGEGADTFSFGGAELPDNTIYGSLVIKDFNAREGDQINLANLLPPLDAEDLDQYLSITRSGDNDLVLTIDKSGQKGGEATDHLQVRLEGVLADGGSNMDGMTNPTIDDLVAQNIIILNKGDAGGATIIPQLPPDERPNDPSLPPDERPDNSPLPPPLMTPDDLAVRVRDERFVLSRYNDGPENFEHVLRNDGEGVKLTGVLDEDGYLVTLAALAGDGLETRTGKLFMQDGTLVFQPKAGVDADDTEIVTYVGEDADGKAYTQNVEIRFIDTASGFSADDGVDTYYVNTYDDAVILQADNNMAQDSSSLNVHAGDGNNDVDVKATRYMAYNGSSVNIDAGDGNNNVNVEAGQFMAYTGSSVDVRAGDGNDTIESQARVTAWDTSTVSVAGGAGDDVISVKSDITTAFAHSSVNVDAGDGNDTIAIEAQLIAESFATVTVDAGDGNDDVTVKSSKHYIAYRNSSVHVDASDGNDTITIEAANRIAESESTVTVDGGAGNDVVSVTSQFMAYTNSSVDVDAGVGNDTIAIEAEQYVAYKTSTVTVDGGADNDVVSVKSLGPYMAYTNSSVDVSGGDGDDKIAIEAKTDIADATSTVTVNGGAGNDLIEMRGGHSDGGVSLTGGEGKDIFSFGGAELPGNTISGSFVITDFNARDGDMLQLKNLLPPDADGSLDQYLSITRSGGNNEDLLLTINKSSGAATDLTVRLEGVLDEGGSMGGMSNEAISELITSHTIIQNSGG